MILAANLTDSIAFPPLLAIFVVSTTWALLVHTLRTEAIEAGDSRAAAQLLTSGLLRTTLVSSGLSILLALVLFVVLPRMRGSVVTGPSSGGVAVSGFSDRVELGTIGRIRQDNRVVLRVETLEGDAPPRGDAYWRCLAFDTFDGREWSINPSYRVSPGGSVKFGIPLSGAPPQRKLVQRIVREPVQAGVLFGVGSPRALIGALSVVEADANRGFYAPAQSAERVHYTITTEAREWSDAELVRDAATLPDTGPRPARYLAIPEFDPAVAALAQRIASGLPTDAERALAIEAHLQREGVYTDLPPTIDANDPRSPIEVFLLGELSGHCEYFASGMVVLARSIGLPARLVNGFAGGRENSLGGFVELTRADAHAWVEIHYRDADWVRYDPTPADLRLRAITAPTMTERLAELGSVLELWWFQRIVDFDTSDQVLAIKGVLGGLRKLRGDGENGPAARSQGESWRPDARWAGVLLTVLGLGATALVGRSWWKRRRAGPGPPREYRTALRLLARRGLVRGVATPARTFAREVADAVSPAAAGAFAELTEGYLAECFGGAAFTGAPALVRLRAQL